MEAKRIMEKDFDPSNVTSLLYLLSYCISDAFAAESPFP